MSSDAAFDAALAKARATLYGILAAVLASPPTADALAAFAAKQKTDDEGELADALAAFANAADAADSDAVADDYHDLFIGLGRGRVSPFASRYLTGFLMEKPLADVRRDLAALGVVRKPGVFEPEDHAAALCETMAMLADGDDDGDGESFIRQKIFFERHLAKWLPDFFTDLAREAKTSFYKSAARLGASFIAFEKRFFN